MNQNPLDDHRVSSLADLLDALVSENQVSVATAIVASPDSLLDEHTVTLSRAERKAQDGSEARFDLASLTKPWAATVALDFDTSGAFSLDTTIGSVWSHASESLKRITMADLLRHEGGFQTWAPLYRLCSTPQDVADFLLEGDFLGAEAGTYSDLDYILWGLTAEKALGQSLENLYAPPIRALSPDGTLGPASSSSSPIHACGLDTEVEQNLALDLGYEIAALGPPAPEEVQDGNARFLGGFSSHAGLFGSARDLVELGRCWLSADRYPEAATVKMALSGDGPYGLGWVRRDTSKSAGNALDEFSFGHTGFTGCSLWVDPTRDRVLVLAAHRTSTKVDLSRWRRAFHRIALRE